MEHKDAMDVAYRIYKDMDGEAACRASISRSYYAAFHPARETADRLGLDAHGNTHERVIRAFEKRHPGIHESLIGLRSNRVAADYKLDREITASRAKAALAKSRKLQEKLESL